MEVLAAAAQQEVLRESDGSLGSSEHVQPQSQRCRWQPTRSGAAARGGSSSAGSPGPAAGGGAGGSGAARTKAAITAEVAASHGARVAADPADALTGWAAEVAEQLGAADAAYTAARDAHQAADAERAAAREAYRADQKSEGKSAEWHAKVATAQQAHDALREAREALYSLQALAELLGRELARRGLAPPPGAADSGGGGAAPGGGEAWPCAVPASQGTKRKRGAPPEGCPFCGHCYTVRDGLSSKLDAGGGRLHLRRCQCRKKTPPCRNCPECKQRADVMQLGEGAAFELCQRQYACAICACKCPGAGKWIESDPESRRAFRERTQERQDMLAQLGWQDASAAQPTSTAGGTASAATAAPSTSAGQEAVQQRPRRRAASQQQPAGGASAGGAQSARSGPSRRLPADIRQQLEALQAQRTQQAGQHTTGQSLSSGHPHEDCTSDCCSAPTVPAPGSAMAAAAAPCVAAPDPACLSALAAALQQQAASSSDAPSLAAAAAPGSLLLLCEQLGLPATLAAALQAPSGPAAAAAQAQAPPVASTSPELPGEVTALVSEVFEHAAGPALAAEVVAFLRRQRLTSLGDFEFLELPWLERELVPLGLSPLLLNKFVQLGRRRAVAAGGAGAAATCTAAAVGGRTAADAAPRLIL
ncbi:hypothetical protein C2E20_7306 [Micractinium conductrix]|uniref:Uncharacterized protein n=1 Tax=Micractinium conductrix TaxID=554055 RepID=A0A2P6V4Z9_9CHLO|nr:hypothetical protein C2E20_7306 [Micractinium conductrix]|eukprot:PSC69166.1 hypothetical protein C2E20_7306 [Micractinium conductrix]